MSGHHHHGHAHHHHHGALTRSAAIASVATALFLLLLKSFAAWQTGSVAMLGSLADTGLDLLASLVILYGVRVAATPADADHRFGHGKAEALAALFQVALITFSAAAIGWRAVVRLGSDQPTAHAEFGVSVSLIAIAATFALLAYQRSVIKRTGSVAIQADNVHYQTDLLLNLSVIAALILEQYFGIVGADPVMGIAIALWLAWGAFQASSQAIDQLMDREWPDEKRRRFLDVAAAHPAMKGIHDFRTRRSGSRDFAQFHMYVAPQMTVAEAHNVMDEVEANIAAAFPGIEILIHLDPEGHIDQPGNELVEADVTPLWFGKKTMNLRFVQVDAFADRPFTGNQAAVMPLDAWLPDEVMQAIAEENNLAETAFTVPTDGDADYDLRWFTPTAEVALCGHATLASGHVLLEGDEIRFRTRKAGVLIVRRDGDALTLDLPVTLVEPAEDDRLLQVLGTPDAELFLSYAGAEGTAIVLLRNEEAVHACAPDIRALRDIDLMIIVTAPGASGHDVTSRVFVPAWGVDEDPVTGSAHAALTPFWAERLGRDNFTAFQASKRGGMVACRLARDRAILGGRCVTVIEGTFRL